MVGLGFFESGQFIVRQYFMRHHAEEPAMLTAVGDELRRFVAVVTFNGKAFDLPLLQTRFTQTRLRPRLPTDPHLDILHAARRFWRDRLESCSLASIEAAILGHARERDVPSWVIPELYFRYVRGGDARAMARVFDHNRDDILSLAAITCRLGRVLGAPTADADVHDLFAVARLLEDLGLWDDACACYELALEAGRGTSVRRQVASRLAALCKRAGRSERAVQLWRRLAVGGPPSCEPYIELAKHYEHRVRDYAAAIAVVEEALVVVQLREARRVPSATSERAELERRLARLLAKQQRAGARTRRTDGCSSPDPGATGAAR
ncbi:MAG: ribonuclease H-like domain-containing protein [Chloroflexota bacterium]|nr:ribonuclease H-like domain-containing protein [Chloroflexota bacterium]